MAEVGSEAAAPDGARAWVRRNGLLTVVVLAIFVPFAVGIIWRIAATGDDFASFDPALLELGVRAVGRDSVLVGPYSRFGWNHPGPLYLYWLAVPYRLLGSTYGALAVGAVLVNVAATAGIVLVAWRRGGRALATWTGAVIVVYLAAAGPIAFDSWNPWVTILPFTLAVLLAWSLACGDLWALPVLVGVVTFLVQTHVSYAAPVGAVTVGAIVVVAIDARRERQDERLWPARRRALVRSVGIAAIVLVVLWIPPIVDQLIHDPGNLGQIFRFAREGQSDNTITDGIEEVARYLGVLPARLVEGATIASAGGSAAVGWSTVLTFLAVAAAAFVALRRRQRDALVLIGFAALAAVAGVITVSRIVGPRFDYLVHWMTAIGAVLWIAVGAVLVAPASRERVKAVKVPAWITVVAAVLLVTGLGWLARDVAVAGQRADRDADRPPIETMVERLERRLPPPGGGVVAMRVPQPSFFAWQWVAGVVLELQRRGYDVRVERGLQSDVLFSPWDLVEPGTAPVAVSWDTVQPGRHGDVEVKGLSLDVIDERRSPARWRRAGALEARATPRRSPHRHR
jgi:hypothetical protein